MACTVEADTVQDAGVARLAGSPWFMFGGVWNRCSRTLRVTLEAGFIPDEQIAPAYRTMIVNATVLISVL